MARPKKSENNNGENKTTFSPYMLLNAWFRDGNMNSPLPKDIEDCKAFNQSLILYYFVTSPKLFIFINKNYNNFSLFNVPTIDILKTMKEIIRFTGFKQQYTATAKKESNQLSELLWRKYPHFKKDEIMMAIDIIDNDEEMRDIVYENYGIRNPKKLKSNAKEFKKKMSTILSKESLLNDL